MMRWAIHVRLDGNIMFSYRFCFILTENDNFHFFCWKWSFSVSWNRFYVSKTCAIDFSRKITHSRVISRLKDAKNKITIFASKPFSMNQVQWCVFTGMRAIDFRHKITPRGLIFRKINCRVQKIFKKATFWPTLFFLPLL